MKVFRCLFAIALVCGLTSLVAKADPVDFKASVLDGPVTGFDITSLAPFPVIFGTCPTSITGDGCFLGINKTGVAITTLSLIFPDTGALGGQPVTCDTSVPGSIFSSANCSLSNNGTIYTLDFSGGSIPPCTMSHHDDEGDDDDDHPTCGSFYIVETGVDPSVFPEGTGIPNAVPEPDTMLLLSTGIATMGTLIARRRRLSK